MTFKPYVLATDPGLLSGICLLQRDPFQQLWSAEGEWQDIIRQASNVFQSYGGENIDVVLEKYTITASTAKKTQQPWSLEIIGMFRCLSWMYGAGSITLQTPADAKSFATNERLRALGLWHVGGEGHALDALRHGLLRLARTGFKDQRMVLS